jgi:hypothetical protein
MDTHGGLRLADFDTKELLDAIPLQVHRKTKYHPMVEQLTGLFGEVVILRAGRNQQLRKAERIKKHLDVLVLDLWVAANYYPSPWRMISRNKSDYRLETRYRKIYLKHALLIGVLDDLVQLGYIEEKRGFFDKHKGRGFQTRIRATPKLLGLLTGFDIAKLERDPEAPEEEVLILRDKDNRQKDYPETRFTSEMRNDLSIYNAFLRQSEINTEAVDLRYQADPTAITAKMMFKGDSIEEGKGGRIYGGFWENMRKQDRLKLMLQYGPVVELDYVAIHPTIAYAFKGIPLTEDPYLIEGCERNDVKKTFLVLFNCKDRKHALDTIRSSFHIKGAEALLSAIEQKHEPIKNSFYNPGFGMTLQNTDAWLAMRILKRMTEQGIACLPIHDSFIVNEKYAAELRTAMDEVFFEIFLIHPSIK